jgi:hypothetical protein
VSRYTEQYDRAKRYLARFREIDGGQPHDKPTQAHQDDVYAFFQNCYHLKDWIKNDPATAAWSDVEAFISNDPDLSICADLCNSTKHLALSRRPRSAVNPQHTGSDIHLIINESIGGGETSIAIAMKFHVTTTSGDVDAFQLAERCLAAWQRYLGANGVTP